MTRLASVDLRQNEISDVRALVDNPGLGRGDEVNLELNPLSQQALTVQIPALIRRGVRVTGVELGDVDVTSPPEAELAAVMPEPTPNPPVGVGPRPPSVQSPPLP